MHELQREHSCILTAFRGHFSFQEPFSKISYHHIFKKTLSLPSTGGLPWRGAPVSSAPQAFPSQRTRFLFLIVYKCEESSRPVTVHSLGHPLSSQPILRLMSEEQKGKGQPGRAELLVGVSPCSVSLTSRKAIHPQKEGHPARRLLVNDPRPSKDAAVPDGRKDGTRGWTTGGSSLGKHVSYKP